MNVLSLDEQSLGDWSFKVSANSTDGTLLILALHQVTRCSYLKAFRTPESAKIWVNRVSTLPDVADVDKV